jgi:uncharacterized protein (DUF1501 family)
MERRQFLTLAGLAGLAVVSPLAVREGHAENDKYAGPYWIMVNAGGGWDPTMLCDPKGGADPQNPKAVNHAYTPAQIGKAGAISYAPIAYSSNGVPVQSAKSFFEKHGKRLTILNGVDTSTNNHDAGSRTIWSGQLSEGHPSFAALAAAFATRTTPVPLAYLSSGGFDATAGLVSLARIGDTGSIRNISYPNAINPNDPNSTDTFHTADTAARIAKAQNDRIDALRKKERLTTVGSALSSLFLARQSDGGLSRLGDELANVKLVNYPGDFPALAGADGYYEIENMLRQAQIALHSFKSGVAVSANLDFGGFDTHDNADDRQTRQLMGLLFGLDYLFTQIDALGLTDQVYVMVGSDFGRTPYYNSGNGKDHWNITSVMCAGPKIPGNRVIGSTDAEFKTVTLNPKTLAPDPSGIRLEPMHLHHALRKIAGITGTDLDTQFGLPGDELPLFG